jgi:hypothetical protein
MHNCSVRKNYMKLVKSISISQIRKFFPFLLSAIICGGCASNETQVQKAAKDWCMTIRGSQVIPVYPLTEDIQPGDIFLVQVPIDKQQALYELNGFLALDNHLDRINPTGYDRFYDHSFFSKDESVELPRDWIRPSGTNQSWQLAPHVAFPSYSFTVRNGAGMNLAVPVEGVPVGLSLMASDAASGTIEIKNSYTMGVDTISLYRQLEDWAKTNKDFLCYFEPRDKQTNYLRVVTRIYATGKMSVSLMDASSRSGGLDAGVPKPVNLLTPTLPAGLTNTADATLQNYTNAWNTLSQIVQLAGTAKDAAGNMLPGGSLRLTAASARSVSLDESFNPPVVFGYLGFDCIIATNGELGTPIPTYAILGQIPVQIAIRQYANDDSAKILRDWINNPQSADIPPGKTARDVTKDRESKITSWIKTNKADYNFAQLLDRADLESERQLFIKQKGSEYKIIQPGK